MDNMNETLKKILTLLVAFLVILLVAILLMIVIMWILKVAEDIVNAPGISMAAATLLGAMIIGSAIYAKK